ncbi:MAG: DUF2179 domain-containing protein [Bacilli bacterium]|nr:DUF2179 domain-containing protein [Bacilli bacterium]
MQILFLCIKIFLVRIIDVSLGTFRTLITVKGKSLYASIIGFIEVFIWFMIVREALNTDVNNIWVAISYSLGFATGTYLGSIISNKFIKTNLSFEIITSKKEMITELRSQGYGVTVLDVKGRNEKENKYMLLLEIKNSSSNSLKNTIKEMDENAFIIVTETKYVQNGYFK